MFYEGKLLFRYNIADKKRSEVTYIFIFIISFWVLLICDNLGTIGLVSNNYKDPIYFLIVSLADWQFLYEISYFILKINLLKKVMICVGRNTLPVVILHFLCFKIVSYIEVIINGDPICLVAAFPTLYTNGLWWVAYTVVGLVSPVCLSLMWKKGKLFIGAIIKKSQCMEPQY